MIDRMIAVAVDADRLSILEMNAYATAAGAHVAGGGDDVVGMRAIRRSTRRPVSATGLMDMDSPSGAGGTCRHGLAWG